MSILGPCQLPFVWKHCFQGSIQNSKASGCSLSHGFPFSFQVVSFFQKDISISKFPPRPGAVEDYE